MLAMKQYCDMIFTGKVKKWSFLKSLKTLMWIKALSALKKAVQSEFDYSKIRFTEEYYDVLGLEPPERILKTERDYEEVETVEIIIDR